MTCSFLFVQRSNTKCTGAEASGDFNYPQDPNASEQKRYTWSFASKGDEGPDQPSVQLSSYDFLWNMTNRNISNYLVKNRKENWFKLIGGMEFGVYNSLATVNISQVQNAVSHALKVSN